jgi:hypothetical protein
MMPGRSLIKNSLGAGIAKRMFYTVLLIMNKLSKIFLLLSLPMALAVVLDGHAQQISRSFELRYYTPDEKANGETDFKGDTEYFSTEQRIEYLEQYARAAKDFFNDQQLDKKVVTDQQAQARLSLIKPQPQPQHRNRLLLEDWLFAAHHPEKAKQEIARMQTWLSRSGGSLQDEKLYLKGGSKPFTIDIPAQTWRFFVEFETESEQALAFQLLDKNQQTVASTKISNDQLAFLTAEGEKKQKLALSGSPQKVRLEVDLENARYNIYRNGELVADFVKLPHCAEVHHLSIAAEGQAALDDVYGVGYQKAEFTEDLHTRDVPFSVATFIDEDFAEAIAIQGWQEADYDDSRWQKVSLPYAHGGERYKHEPMYLRKKISVDDFEKALLSLETLDPGGEVWINGELAFSTQERIPYQIDVGKFLKKGEENLLAIKIYPNQLEHTNRHTPNDIYTGWFSGRIHLDLMSKVYIDDAFAYTESLKGDDAIMQLQITMQNEDWQFEEREMKKTREFFGSVTTRLYPWFPEEGAEAVAEQTDSVYIHMARPVELRQQIKVANAALWTPENPQLYKLVVELKEQSGKIIDDYVLTTGIRTISQEGGTFRLNGQPAMMNGALLFGYRAPYDKIAQWLRCGPDEWLIKEMMMLKAMNGNTFRMSIHHGMKGGVNDPRIADYADQMGVMLQWTTGTWVRTGSPWLLKTDRLPIYVRQVRNHPSIVMWQPANHPKFVDFETETIPWFKEVYEHIYPHDPSRLINPAANNTRMLAANDDGTLNRAGEKITTDPVWTAPMVTRGDMDHATGYGASWTSLRLYPYPPNYDGEQGWREAGYRTDYLNSKERAYFDFESEESIGQPNWELRKGKPEYQIHSYEWDYDKGSIGRRLTADEWEISQAWQAFSAFEAYKKKRWLDYDGLAWCPLRGGGNSATYAKPVIDYYDHAKLGFYALQMVLQPTVGGSHDVDLVYGPEDVIKPVIMHVGEATTAELEVEVLDAKGKRVDRKTFRNISLAGGRNATELPEWQVKFPKEGHYTITYEISKK